MVSLLFGESSSDKSDFIFGIQSLMRYIKLCYFWKTIRRNSMKNLFFFVVMLCFSLLSSHAVEGHEYAPIPCPQSLVYTGGRFVFDEASVRDYTASPSWRQWLEKVQVKYSDDATKTISVEISCSLPEISLLSSELVILEIHHSGILSKHLKF